MNGTVLVVAAAAGFALLAGCAAPGGSDAPPSSTASTGSSATGPGSTTGPAPAPGACPVGEYQVTGLTGRDGVQVQGQRLMATSGGGLTMVFTAAGDWELTGTGATITLTAGPLSVRATVDGSANGRYERLGPRYTFLQEEASGTVTLEQELSGTRSIPMATVGPALAPTGTATLTCADDTMTISSDSVELRLRRTGPSQTDSSQTDPSPTGASPTGAPGPPSTGAAGFSINDSGTTVTIVCEGRPLTVNGSGNRVTLNGTCPALTINGTGNHVRVEEADRITVRGSTNTIIWSRAFADRPRVDEQGDGNTITKG